MADGTAQPSMATIGLEKQEEFGISDLEMAYTLSGPWDAGVGTVRLHSTSITAFVSLWLMHIEADTGCSGSLPP